ncbi:MAG TPA: aspartyl-phosphate phosphatase Spo0E family protein [Bacillales bacterium]|nr:aspartyl-phosphate phosphatase Spo0E family protein [Bacillales bacterium]
MNTITSLAKLEKQIDELRKSMIEIGTKKGLAHVDTVKISTKLDKKLNIYRKMISK